MLCELHVALFEMLLCENHGHRAIQVLMYVYPKSKLRLAYISLKTSRRRNKTSLTLVQNGLAHHYAGCILVDLY